MMKNDTFFWFKENTLTIPGVTGERLIMHITDSHLHVRDGLSTDEEKAEAERQEAHWMTGKENFARGNGEPFGDAQRISSTEAFEKALALAGELKPDLLVLTGDNLDYMHPAGERYLRSRLGGYGGKFLCVPGNHESESCNGVWSPGVRTCDLGGAVVAAIDDRKGTLTDGDLAELERICGEGKPVIVVCHIPVSTDLCRGEMEKLGAYFYIDSRSEDENARRFVSLLESGAVKAVICGHVHGYHRMEIAPGVTQIIGSQAMAGAVDLVTVKGE
ncbi:MAG: metallophosphoesterase [Clostridia bacterium]|nr:metallophosphoesterase [Clostridia bacterium]